MTKRVRYFYRRQAARLVGRALQALLTRTTVSGLENVPPQGPYIAVGNHMAAVEAALMVVNLPHVPELVGNGDVPMDPTFSLIAGWYKFIPIRRGYVDRAALQEATSVLEQGNVLGAFPEGGIWDDTLRSARPGVAWLSQRTGAPILPIGFGGVRGAVGQILRFGRPKLSVNIGPLMPPVPNPRSARARREAIDEASEEIMARIQALIPAPLNGHGEIPREEKYDFRLEITDRNGRPVPLPAECAIPYGSDLGYYFHRHVLLEVVYRNYRLTGARPLADYPVLNDPARLRDALGVALDFYRRMPIFLGYRLGYARAERVMLALGALHGALDWAAQQGYRVQIVPQRTLFYTDDTTKTLVAPSVKREY